MFSGFFQITYNPECTHGNGPEYITSDVTINWKNLMLFKKYRLADLPIIGNKSILVSPQPAVNPSSVHIYDTFTMRKIPDDGSIIQAITVKKCNVSIPNGIYSTTAYQWGMDNNNKVVYCKSDCPVGDIYIYSYGIGNVSTGATGLCIYNSDKTVLYNSNLKYFKPLRSMLDFSWDDVSYSNIDVAVTMPFCNISFDGSFSKYTPPIFFLSQYKDSNGYLLYGYFKGTDDLPLADEYFFNPQYSIVDVSNF
ncbi:hypothetical protein [Megasphaera sp.]|uniref:hypothetical protein n=1 Tax=Megasphaera sp. TaxID=2023260 RepID=UPI004026A57E